MLSDVPTNRERPLLVLSGLAALAALGSVFVPSVLGSFFLYDDFGVVGVLAASDVLSILTTPIGGFYRPAALLALFAETLAFGFRHPIGYALVSALLQVGCAGAAWAFQRRLGLPPVAACAGAVVFLASPWAAETYLWPSAQFDLLATLGVLLALCLGLDYVASGSWAALAGAGAAAVLAVGSKESALPLPVLAFLSWGAAARMGPRSRVFVLVGLLASIALLYLWLRAGLLPGLVGPYGPVGDALAASPLAANLLSFARAMVVLPFDAQGWLLWDALVLIAWAAAGVAALRFESRRAALLACAFLATLGPVAWARVALRGTAQGRYLHLAGVFAAALFALGLARLPRPAALGALAALLTASLASLLYQADLWKIAADLSRRAVARVESALPTKAPLYIPDLPATFKDGPYILKSNDFRFYFGARLPHPVRATALTLMKRGSRLVVVDRYLDRFSDHAGSAGEQVLRLDLGVEDAP